MRIEMTDVERLTVTDRSAAHLVSEGWQRRFVADGGRLLESIEAYEEMGVEVALLPISTDEAECDECMKAEPDRYRVIYTRDATHRRPAE